MDAKEMFAGDSGANFHLRTEFAPFVISTANKQTRIVVAERKLVSLIKSGFSVLPGPWISPGSSS